jgi:uncharacterized membrane protein YeaQ/YmgE (transglycosylase-associated protein family)
MNLNFDLNTILIWLGMGSVAGLLAYLLIPGVASGGITAALIIGLIGGFIGGLLGQQVMTTGMLTLPYTPLAMAVIGGVLFVLIQKITLHQTKYFKTENQSD